ncbi:MAG: hypothetical protein RIB59_12945 [Rhodospirillales bacterium]
MWPQENRKNIIEMTVVIAVWLLTLAAFWGMVLGNSSYVTDEAAPIVVGTGMHDELVWGEAKAPVATDATAGTFVEYTETDAPLTAALKEVFTSISVMLRTVSEKTTVSLNVPVATIGIRG